MKHKHKQTISLCIPTLNEAKTIGKLITRLKKPLMDKRKLLDKIIVVDSGSTDNTEKIARKAGAEFYYADNVLKRYGAEKGKGENLWKAQYLSNTDLLVFLDGDIKNIHPRFVYGLVGPLLTNKKLGFIKSFYQRPVVEETLPVPLGGGRVTEILIRPLFNMYFPQLRGFIQPLSGQFAARRKILDKLSFFTGYGVETAMLIDVDKKFSLSKMAQVDLIEIQHRPQSLTDLSNMSFSILQVFAKRANTLGKLIQVGKIRKNYKIIESRKAGSKIIYILKNKPIQEKQRPPMITIKEYRKKFGFEM